ncbi:hypothetical protein PQX77_016306 [Marasmius sp. AFHP31]|nr:hypothetical protein PQX77_016306 [Marasmius sp. AFHP31]
MPSQMQALASVWLSSSMAVGGHGHSYQVGTPQTEISGGLKQLPSNSSCTPSSLSTIHPQTSKSMEITKASLRPGGTSGAEISMSMNASAEFTVPFTLMAELQIQFTQGIYVCSIENPADEPSRGRVPPARLLLPPIAIPPSLSEFVTDFDSPISRSLQNRSALPKPRLSTEEISLRINSVEQLKQRSHIIASDETLRWWE